MPKVKKEIFIVVLIFIFALFLRVWNLNNLPFGFHEDEMSNTYVGRFILENGKDLYGNPWPLLYFDKFGDYPPVLPMYVSGLSTYVFGVSEFAARFPTALVGALTVFPIYLLAVYFFNSRNIGLISAFFLSVLPWHLVYSRSSAEGIVALFFFSLGLAGIFNFIEKKKKVFFFSGFLSLMLTYFLYPSFRLLVPLSLLPIPFMFRKAEKENKRFLFASLFVSLLLTFWISTTTWGKARFEQTSLFTNPDIAVSIKAKNEALSFGVGENKILEARIFHNKIIGYFREFLKQYFSYFSLFPLFIEGGEPYQYFSIPEQGFFYIVFLPLIFLGFVFLSANKKKDVFYLVFLLIMSVLPAALTVDFSPHFHRAILLILPLVLIGSFGFELIGRISLGRVKLSLFLLILFIGEFLYFTHQYARISDSFKSLSKSDSIREAVQEIIESKGDYEQVIASNKKKMSVYYLFLTKDFSQDYIGRFGYNLALEKIDNIVFFDEWCPSDKVKEEDLNKKILIVDEGDCEESKLLKERKMIKRTDSTKAYKFLIPITN